MKPYLLRAPKETLLALICKLIQTLGRLATALLSMWMLRAAMDGDLRTVGIILLANGGAWAVFALFGRWSTCFRARAIARMNTALRCNITAQIFCGTESEPDDNLAAGRLSWYINDVAQAEKLGYEGFFSLCFCLIDMIIAFIALLCFHWSLALIALFSSVIMMCATALSDKTLKAGSGQVSRASEVFTEAMRDVLGGLPMLRSFGAADRLADRTRQESDQLESVRCDFVRRQENAGLLAAGASIITQAMTLALLFGLAIRGVIPFSTIYGGGNIISMASNSTIELGQLRIRLVSAKPYFDKLGRKPEYAPDLPPLPAVPCDLTFEDVTFGYPGKPILDHWSMTFRQGGKYALTGPSGCGKTTVLRLIAGLLRPVSGCIRFGGCDAAQYAPESRWNTLAYIDQEVYLLNTTIRDNITLGRPFAEEALQQALQDSALAGDLLKMPQGLDTVITGNGHNLSGGQRQRIAVARALLYDRSVLLVDEGTSALDAQNAAIVEEALLRKPELTLILVSHHLDEERKKRFDQCIQMG